MPDLGSGKQVARTRREGRRTLAAYDSHSRGDGTLRRARRMYTHDRISHPRRSYARRPSGAFDISDAGAWSAGIALSLVFPLIERARSGKTGRGAEETRGSCMKKKPSIRSLDTVTLEEAEAYLAYAGGDELSAALTLAADRNR